MGNTMQRSQRGRWTRPVIGIAVIAFFTGMAFTSIPFKRVTIRPEIDLLLDDISEEPTPDNISTLISKARARRQRGGWGDGSLDPNNLAPNEVAHVARYLRKQYAFKSLAPRLAYEQEENSQAQRFRLGVDANAWLNELESEPASDVYSKMDTSGFIAKRASALEKLHGEEVVAFINRDGEGISRMPTYGVEYVILPEIPAIPLASEADTTRPPPEAAKQFRRRHDEDRKQRTRTPFFELHASYRKDFAGTRNGLVVDVDQVAGFAPHAITRRQDILSDNTTGPQEVSYHSDRETQAEPLWRVCDLQLVSLLKFSRPYVYVSEFMPAMTELPDLEKRGLSSFENKALKQLYAGKDIISEATDHKIKLLGSLRASKDCLSCHSVDRGDLLGAFSYELVRVGSKSDSESKNHLAQSTSHDHEMPSFPKR